MRTKKLGRVVLSFALAAALVAEPAASMPVVYAEEVQPMEVTDPGNGDMGEPETVSDNSSGEPGKEEGTPPGEGGNSGEGENSVEGEGSGEGEDPDEGDDPAEGENPEEEADGEAETVSDNSSEETEEDDEKDKESGDFSDMPDGYQLTSYQKELKSELGNMLYQVSESDEGVTYAESEVYTYAESREEAEMIAAAYHAEIVDFDMGILTLKLGGGVSVKSALAEAADLSNNLPAVWPNYRRELFGEVTPEATENDIPGLEVVEEEYALEGQAQQEAGDEVPSLEAYEQALNELTAYNDPYLQPVSESYQWFHTTIGTVYAWDAGYKGQGIRVGVIDSGVDSNADLDANVVDKKDFCDGTTDAADNTGDGGKHGTHVAGIIAALQNGSQGAGVAPGAKIYNAKVFGTTASKSGNDATIEKAILYLINENEADIKKPEPNYDKAPLVDVINMSLGGPGYNPSMQKTLDKAKKKGVVVLAASGNDGGQLSQYPASYNNVISVAATDINNQRASFSNYGPAVDVSAPGVDIWSTYGNSYASLQGTSMACPVASGEAAVILSGAGALNNLNGKSRAARVNAVETIMKNNAMGVGGGMGKGITSLPKVFGLTVAAAKPNAPKGVWADTSSDKKQSMELTLTAQSGMKICYTTNGKNPVWQKDGTAGADTTLVNGNTVKVAVNGNQAAKGTVKAIAVNAAGVVSNVKAYAYTLKPFVKTVTIAGPKRVEQSKSIKLSATVAPAYATTKTVTWAITTAAGAAITDKSVKIDGTGKITTTAKAAAGKYQVTATAKDQGTVKGTYEIEVVALNTAIQNIVIKGTTEKPLTKELWLNSTQPVNQVNLFEYVVAKEKDLTAKGTPLKEITDKAALKTRLKWTSSKPAVAAVDDDGNVTAKAPGKAKITVKADDNLGKAASVEITVKQAVTGITITSPTDKYTVAKGKSITLKATVTPAKPAPANKNVIWSIEAPAGVNDAKKDQVKIDKTGKVTVPAKATAGTYTVTATAADKQGKTATKAIMVFDGGAIGGIAFAKGQQKITLFTKKGDDKQPNTATVTATITGVKDKKGNVGTFDATAYKVTNSNPAVVTESVTSNGAGVVTIQLTTTGNKKGNANIVVAATDGSGKKATCAVTVNGAINGVQIVDSLTAAKPKEMKALTLFRKGLTSVSSKIVTNAAEGKSAIVYNNVTPKSTATLYAKINAPATANSQAYEVVSSDPKLVKVTSYNRTTGAIELETSGASTGQAVITLKTTDGSNKKAACTVKVVNPASRINIAPKNGAGYCVAWGKTLQLSAVPETNHGAVANKAVTWSAAGYEQYLTVDQTGKVKVKANAGGIGGIPITATAKDGSGVTAVYRVAVVPPTTKLVINARSGWIAQGRSAGASFTSNCSGSVICTSSNPSVVSPTISYDPYVPTTGKGGVGRFSFTANKKGTAKITVKALDGTGKSASVTVIVR